MRSRRILLAIPLFALSSPVAAQDVVFITGTGQETAESAFLEEPASSIDEDRRLDSISDKISDPIMQDGVASAVESMTETMMRLPVGQFVEAIERARPGTVNRRYSRDTTIADIAGRDADALPEKLGDSSRQMMSMVGGFAKAMSVMMPEFERMGREMEEGFRAAKAEARRVRD